MSRPWMPFYVSDYVADTMHLGTLEHGAYVLLILHYWRHGSLPDDDGQLARIVRATPEQWADLRPALLQFFGDGWTHKRIDAELSEADAKYTRRAEAGRIGGMASGASRRGKVEAMLQRTGTNAEAGLNQPQPQPQSHKKKEEGAGAPSDDLSDEDWYWNRLDLLEGKKISRSQCTKLLKLIGHDFTEANRVLDQAEAAKKPTQYLGAVIRNMEMAGRTMPAGQNPLVPAWVNEQRAAGVPVERDGRLWRCQGELRDDSGEVVGW
jgi:uncharacterized protein YdaU (DUF1376 family)